MHKCSTIIKNAESAQKIISYFPQGKQKFKIYNIYNGERDGWAIHHFAQKVFNQGPTLIIIKTT